MRAAPLARLLVGAACLGAPYQVLGLIGGPDRDDPLVAGVARVLGARLVVQGGVELAVARRGSGRLGAGIDLAHAVSMLPAAARWPAHRRTALVSAAVAAATAAIDLL